MMRSTRSPGTPALAAHVPAGAPSATRAVSRGEWWLVAAILVVGIGMRIAFLPLATVEHFDEGVYASNLWFGPEASNAYPLRYLYAPPLLPALIEVAVVASQLGGFGAFAAGQAALLPSVLAGCLTLGLIWWTARLWSGPIPAVAAAVLAACSEFQAMYVRTALTDVLLLFWLVLALLLWERAVRGGRLRLACLAGVVVGLAWWTKYNGWLPLLIGLTALVARAAGSQPARARLRQDLIAWSIMAATAVLVWSPCLLGLQEHGGYATVAANHRGYMVGLTGWPQSLFQQWQNLRHFDGWLSSLAPAGAFLAAAVLTGAAFRRRGVPSSRDAHQRLVPALLLALVAAVALLTGLSAWLGSAFVLAGLSMGGLCVAFCSPSLLCQTSVDPRQAERDSKSAGPSHVPAATDAALRRSRARPQRGERKPSQLASQLDPKRDAAPPAAGALVESFAVWLVASWFVVLLVLTPLYSPYPRLALPWLASTWLAGGWGLAALANWLGTPRDMSRRAANSYPSVAAVAVLLPLLSAIGLTMIAGVAGRLSRQGVTAWRDRTGLARAAEEIANELASERAVVLVYAEPALFFQLRAAGVAAWPAPDLAAPASELPDGVTAYLATAWHASRMADFERELAELQPQLAEVASYAYRPSDLVLLNTDRDAALDPDDRAAAKVRLFRWQ